MRYLLLLAFLLISVQNFAQKKTSFTFKDIYYQNGLVYKVSNDSLFTGSIENRRWTNNVLLSKAEYKDGFIILHTNYFVKSLKRVPSQKTYYYENEFFKKKKEDRLNTDGTLNSSIYFDKNGNKTFEEFFSQNELIHSCEYKDGRKNGKEFCISKNGKELNYVYHNGKKIK